MSLSNRVIITFSLFLLVSAGSLLTGCEFARPVQRPVNEGAKTSLLVEHSKIFRRGVEKVTDNVYVAIGYGIANSIMIEGTDGLIVVDTMTTNEEAEIVLSEFQKISKKPIRAIIYTHNHPDHVLGSEVFAREGNPEIYAHETTSRHVSRILTEVRPIIGMRSMRMFGSFLESGVVINDGIGPFVGMKPGSTVGYAHPTRTFSDELEGEAAGIRFRLVFAPGETDDQIFVWLPEQKVLIPGDNFYWAFPNLYTIRGTLFRSLKNWYRSIDKMRDLGAEYMVPCHTRPIAGAESIEAILTDYRDAIQYVHDQAIRGMNMGLTPDELTETVQLPRHLAEAPYLQPFYGKVSWSVRSMFSGNLGWFDGDAATLHPLARRDQAALMVDLAGSEERLRALTREKLTMGEYQAALQLSGHLMQLHPLDPQIRSLRVRALTAIAEREQNPNARHYYLSEALEIRDGFVVTETSRPTPNLLRGFSLQSFFDAMAVTLDPVASAEIDQLIGIQFSDVGEAYTIHVRHGVAEIRQRTPETFERVASDIRVRADSQEWKEMLARLRNPLVTLAGFSYEKGNPVSFARFLALFRAGKPKLPCEPLP